LANSRLYHGGTVIELKPMLLFPLQGALKEVENVEQKLKQLSQLKQDLADYFCEDESKFKLEDLLQIFKTFCNHLDKAKEV
jgi:hypothetical protein